MHFLSRENITLSIALFGAIGTLATWIYAAFTKRRRIDVTLIHIFEPDSNLVVFASFTNRSHLPISITAISLVLGDVSFPCPTDPHLVFRYESSLHPHENSCSYTLNLPLNLGSLSGVSGFLSFDIPPEFLKRISSPLILKVSTSRGSLPQKRLFFEDYSTLDVLL